MWPPPVNTINSTVPLLKAIAGRNFQRNFFFQLCYHSFLRSDGKSSANQFLALAIRGFAPTRIFNCSSRGGYRLSQAPIQRQARQNTMFGSMG